MGEGPVSVCDTNVLINLALPVVDQRERAPSGEDPLKAMLSLYDVHVPSVVVGEVTEIAQGHDLLGTAADLVLLAASNLTIHEVGEVSGSVADFGLDIGESRGIALANLLEADLFITDEFNSVNLQLIHLAIFDSNIVFTTPHLLCSLAEDGVLDPRYVDHALTYYMDTRHWDRSYLDQLRECYLH